MNRPCLVLGFLLFLLPAAFAQLGTRAQGNKAKPDPRVRSALEELGFAFTLTAQNDYKLKPLATEGERTQLVYVNSNTQHYGSLEIREVLAPAYLSSGPLPAALANRLLRENSEVKLGAWRVAKLEEGDNAGKYLVLYAIQIAADSDTETLRLAIKNVALTADMLEKELSPKDDY